MSSQGVLDNLRLYKTQHKTMWVSVSSAVMIKQWKDKKGKRQGVNVWLRELEGKVEEGRWSFVVEQTSANPSAQIIFNSWGP